MMKLAISIVLLTAAVCFGQFGAGGGGGGGGSSGASLSQVTNIVNARLVFPELVITPAANLTNVFTTNTQRTIVFSNGHYNAGSDITISNGLRAVFHPGAKFTNTGVISWRGYQPEADHLIFDGVTVNFTNNNHNVVLNPAWWGAIAGETLDCGPPFTAMFRAAQRNINELTNSSITAASLAAVKSHFYPLRTIRLASGGIYWFQSHFDVTNAYRGIIDGNGATLHVTGGTDTMLETNGLIRIIDGREQHWKDFTIYSHQDARVRACIYLRNQTADPMALEWYPYEFVTTANQRLAVH